MKRECADPPPDYIVLEDTSDEDAPTAADSTRKHTRYYDAAPSAPPAVQPPRLDASGTASAGCGAPGAAAALPAPLEDAEADGSDEDQAPECCSDPECDECRALRSAGAPEPIVLDASPTGFPADPIVIDDDGEASCSEDPVGAPCGASPTADDGSTRPYEFPRDVLDPAASEPLAASAPREIARGGSLGDLCGPGQFWEVVPDASPGSGPLGPLFVPDMWVGEVLSVSDAGVVLQWYCTLRDETQAECEAGVPGFAENELFLVASRRGRVERSALVRRRSVFDQPVAPPALYHRLHYSPEELSWRSPPQQRGRRKPSWPPSILDMFAGCGGLSCGFEQESGGLRAKWAVDKQPAMAASYRSNMPQTQVMEADVDSLLRQLKEVQLQREQQQLACVDYSSLTVNGHSLEHGELLFHVSSAAGNFSVPARSVPPEALNSYLDANPARDIEAPLTDSRNMLMVSFLQYVDFLRPELVLFENVKGILDGKSKMLRIVIRGLLHLGYQLHVRLLQAAFYGAPQQRKRIFIWAARTDVMLPGFPTPTHGCDKLAYNSIRFLSTKFRRIMEVPKGGRENPLVTIHDAIGDLPLDPVGEGATADYVYVPQSPYQRQIRGDSSAVTEHQSPSNPETRKCVDPFDEPLGPLGELPDTAKPVVVLTKRDKKEIDFARLTWRSVFYTVTGNPYKFLHPCRNRFFTVREKARAQGT
eukprot:m51a1_g2858 putative dna (cytosine-5)-methyltransferase (704) ;mRNA; f:332279-335157